MVLQIALNLDLWMCIFYTIAIVEIIKNVHPTGFHIDAKL